MLNYHELTMTESRGSPQKQKQFAVTCTIMAAVIMYAVMTSGILLPIVPEDGIFPGGHFCYKYAARDYAASKGMARGFTDILVKNYEGNELAKERQAIQDLTYHVYLDDPTKVGGKRQRFMSGILVDGKGKGKIKTLMSQNDKTQKSEFTQDELHDLSAAEVFDMTPFEKDELPSVDALILQFPYTNGVASMLVQSHKVIPKMRKLAKQKGQSNPVVISTCSKEEQMCTHYAPLVKGKKFLLGRPDTETFNEVLGEEELLDWYGMKLTLVYAAEKVGKVLRLV